MLNLISKSAFKDFLLKCYYLRLIPITTDRTPLNHNITIQFRTDITSLNSTFIHARDRLNETITLKQPDFQFRFFHLERLGICGACSIEHHIFTMIGKWSDPMHSSTLHSVLLLQLTGTKNRSVELSRAVSLFTLVVDPSLAHRRSLSANHSSTAALGLGIVPEF